MPNRHAARGPHGARLAAPTIMGVSAIDAAARGALQALARQPRGTYARLSTHHAPK